MGTNHQTSKAYFRKLSLMQFAFIGGILILIGSYCVYFSQLLLNVNTQIYSSPIFLFLVPFSLSFAIAQNFFSHKHKLKALKDEKDLKRKMIGYRELVILRLFVLSGPCFIVIAALARTNNVNYLLYVVFLVCFLIIKRPTIKLAIAELELDQEQIAVLEDQNSIVA